ncbi:hypothetical protein HZS_5355 [Henneguya salminicola]|nr:hypothetical protein HZS_5355 [Henneguya salminicola]
MINKQSYDDIYNQIEPLILEFERFNNIFVISHDSVIRTILSYYLNISRDKTSCIQVPLHHLIKLTRTNAEYKMELYKISLTEEQPLIAYAGNEINYIN